MLLIIVTLILLVEIYETVETRILARDGSRDRRNIANRNMDLSNTKKRFTEVILFTISYVKTLSKPKDIVKLEESEEEVFDWLESCDINCKRSRRLRLLLKKKKDAGDIDALFNSNAYFK